jgi:hypothetical protein
MKEFITYKPGTIQPNNITSPTVFNGLCLIRQYKVTVEEVEESDMVVAQRLRHIWNNRYDLGLGHSSNISAMQKEAGLLGIELD